MLNKFPISKEGYVKLINEIKNLKKIVRVEIINEISEARKHGDLSENAEYHAAKERQNFIESKIIQLENKLLKTEIIDTSKISSEEIKYGASIELLDIYLDKTIVYKIVSDYESDPSEGLISIFSPFAKVLIGKKINELFSFNTVSRKKKYRIISINYKNK